MSGLDDVARGIRDELGDYQIDVGMWMREGGLRSDEDHTDIARAALLAIRAPTPEVIAAMKREIGPLGVMWTAAIDAILGEDHPTAQSKDAEKIIADLTAKLRIAEKLLSGHAANIGPLHAWWDDIFDIRALLKDIEK